MAQLDQIQITYVPAEDRLLLRVSTTDAAEFRFWLTRRFVQAMRPAFGKVLERQPAIHSQENPLARRELLSFERERAVTGSDFETPYRAEPKALPLGDAPVLLTRLQLRPRDGGGFVLAVGPEKGNGIDLALTPPLLHSLSALLDKALAAADWRLAEEAPDASERTPGSATIN